jgi:hypothetical protein
MKKVFTILTVVALTTTVSFSQFSAKAGLNMANIVSNNDDAENGMKFGMIIGGSYAMEISDAMSLNISATFKQSGTKETGSDGDEFWMEEYTTTYALNYLDISPSLVYNVSDQFALSFGPYLAFAMSGNVTDETTISGSTAEAMGEDGTTSDSESIKFGTITLENMFEEDGPDGISAMDFGINIGATYSINDAMSVSAGYALGLTNLTSVDSDIKAIFATTGEDLPSIKNSAIHLTFGYSFGG